MVRITASYKENLPTDSYKTRHWELELSREISESEDPVRATAQLFEIACASVRGQIENAKAVGGFASQVNGRLPSVPTNSYPCNSRIQLATPKQVKYLSELAKGRGLSDEQIKNLASQYYNKSVLGELSSTEASELIKMFSQRQAA